MYIPGYNFNPYIQINLRMEKAISIHNCRTKLYVSAHIEYEVREQGSEDRDDPSRVSSVKLSPLLMITTHPITLTPPPVTLHPIPHLNSPQQTHPTTPHTNSHLIPHPYSHPNELMYSTMHRKHLTSYPHNTTCPTHAINGRHRVESGRERLIHKTSHLSVAFL